MKGQISADVEVCVDADTLWEVYGSLKLGKLLPVLLPNVVQKLEVVEGDGGVGTVLQITFPSETTDSDPTIYKEKFTVVDNEKRVKEAEVVEGGYLDLGFSLYRVRFEVIEKDNKSSILRSTIEYELDDEHAANASFASTEPLKLIAETIGKYLIEKEVPASKA